MLELRAQHVDILGSSPYGIQVLQENIDWMSENEAEIGNWLAVAPTEAPTTTSRTTETVSTESTTSGSQTSEETTVTVTDATTTATKPTEPTTEPSTGTAIQSSMFIMGSMLIILLGSCLSE